MLDVGRFELVTGPRWGALVDDLAALLPAHLASPFAQVRVVVPTVATGKILSQQLAARLGICAGITFDTPSALERALADAAGLAPEYSRWFGTPLMLAVLRAMEESDSPLLRRALSSPRPGQRRATASRIAQVFRHYAEQAPELIQTWTAGSNEGLDGPLPEHFSWQPQVLRDALSYLEVDPVELSLAITEQAEQESVPTFLLTIEEVTASQASLLAAISRGIGVTAMGLRHSSWAEQLATAVREIPGDKPSLPRVELHDSHGPARQVEVLRDELVRAFAKDPTLQPRDALIVCPHPERYARLLDAAFTDPSHPGSQLRLQCVAAAQTGNPVLDLLARILLLSSTRVTASQLTELLLLPAIAHRWRLGDGAEVRELVAGAGIRWGLDTPHRARFHLGAVTQNTWLRGLDRLLIGLASGHDDAGFGIAGAEGVQSSDMVLVGSLAELISRLRRIAASTQLPGTIEDWVDRTRSALADLIGPPADDEWQVVHAQGCLARMTRDHAGDDTVLSHHEFARMLTSADARPKSRVAAGNGSLQVAEVSELVHVEHRLVAMIGISDDVLPNPGPLPDAIELPSAPNPQRQYLAQLLAQAQSAEQLIVVRQGFSTRTGRRETQPVAVTWLLRHLGVATQPRSHPAVATAASAFTGSTPSFSSTALAGALARARGSQQHSPAHRRRTQARSLPLRPPAAHEVRLLHLARFLEDPARGFLRARGGIVRYPVPDVVDELPITVDGLTRWQVIDQTLTALRCGDTIDDVARRIQHSETLPPKEIGKAGFRAAIADARKLWHQAQEILDQDQRIVPVELTFDLEELGTIRVVDQISLHGATAIHMSASSGPSRLIGAWLDCLAMAASGRPSSAKLFRFATWPNKGQPETVSFSMPPDPMAALRSLVRAWVVGQSRLLPIPLDPGIVFAHQAQNRIDPQSWQGPLGDFRTHWPRLGESWPLFYDEDLAELISDTTIDTDPDNGQSRAFPAWALELYGPMVKAMT